MGDLDGTGILWDGLDVRYIGARLSGKALIEPSQLAWSSDVTWGTGILWDGELTWASSRVWGTRPWTGALVWPDRMTTAGVTSPLYEAPGFTGLAEPVPGAEDPTPLEPTFE